MTTLGVGNLPLQRLLWAESELGYSVLQDLCCGFVADAEVTYGKRCSVLCFMFYVLLPHIWCG